MKKEFQVRSDLSEVQRSSAEVLAFLKPLHLGAEALFDIRLCYEEALINAIKYGNRLRPELVARVDIDVEADQIRMRIEDQGEGFDVRRLKDCTRDENIYRDGGRGIYLIHQLMDRVEYNAKGNSVLMVKSLKKEAQTKAARDIRSERRVQ